MGNVGLGSHPQTKGGQCSVTFLGGGVVFAMASVASAGHKAGHTPGGGGGATTLGDLNWTTVQIRKLYDFIHMAEALVKRTTQSIIASVVIIVLGSTPSAADFLFEYSGTVRSAVGSATGGSLLSFAVGDTVSGSFVFDPSGLNPPPGTQSALYEVSIESFDFGPISAVGVEPSYSSFSIHSSNGQISAYKQVKLVETGSIYDSFGFSIVAGAGNSPFLDVLVDLTKIKLEDFQSTAEFFLKRVDIACNPVCFTEVTVTLEALRIVAIPGPTLLARIIHETA